MESYKSFAVTVQGGSHIKSGTVCQDASNFYNDESMSVAVVADGHGDSNCFRSDKGSKFAVACATEGIKQFVKEHEALFKQSKKTVSPSLRELEKFIREKLIKQTVASWNNAVMEHYQKNPFTKQELEKASEKYQKRYENGENINKAYGTSLIAATITPWYWFAYHIGDGRFSVLYKDGSGEQPVPWDPKCFLNVTTSICDDDILDRYDDKEERYTGVRTYLSMKADKEPPVAFFLCSDGIDDNYPADEKENAIHLYRLYREIAVTFAEDGYESTCGQIKDLANEFATKGKGDDTSLAGIVNIEELKKVAPVWKEKMAADEAERKKAKAEADEKAKEEAEQREKTAEEAATRKEARKAEREAERAKAEKEDGENIENYGKFSSNAGQSEGEDAKTKTELVQDARRAIDEAAKKIDLLA
jgi:serine/threonine protein phosphatase PrpC